MKNTLSLKLGVAYYNQGFFNIGKQYQDLLGLDGSTIKVQLGENTEHTITCYINRTANPIGTPRIMCGIDYTNWIQTTYQLGDTLVVDIMADDLIKLRQPV